MAARTRRIVPVIGGVTAVAAAAGAMVPAAQVALAAPDGADVADGSVGALGLAQEGVFESCSAYFGFGKEDAAPNATAFEVTDVEGDDTTAHAVPDDTEVVLVLENAEGATLECIPEEVTEEQWDQMLEDGLFYPSRPTWPGPGHYAYPSVALDAEVEEVRLEAVTAAAIDGFGAVTAVGFRVSGTPVDHTLVSPAGVQPLPDHFALRPGSAPLGSEADPAMLAILEDAAGADAAAAYATAFAACQDDDGETNPDEGDADLLAAIEAIEAILGAEPGEFDPTCGTVQAGQMVVLYDAALTASATYTAPITLAGPVAETPVEPAPAAQPAVTAPDYTG